MANIKSQIKRIKTNEKAYLRNKSVSSSIKTAVRKFREAVAKGDAAVTTAELRAASKALDVAVSKGVIHKNAAANKKSSMAAPILCVEGPPQHRYPWAVGCSYERPALEDSHSGRVRTLGKRV